MKNLEDFEADGDGGGEKDFQVEEDARTLQRMGEIMSDPDRHQKAKARLQRMITHMKAGHGLGKKMPLSKQGEYEKMRESQERKKAEKKY